MKVLNISLEKKLFEASSKSRQRVLGYSRLFNRFDLIVLTGRGYKVLEFPNMNIYPTNSWGKAFYLSDGYFLGKKIIKKYSYDIISAQDPFEAGFIAWLLAKKYKIKLQIQIHGDYFGSCYWRKENLLNGARYYLGRFIVKKADSIRVVSNRTKDSLVKLGLAPDKITVAPIFSAISDQQSAISGKRNSERFIFLTVGRLVKVKNINLQIEAMAEVVKKYPATELWVVGDGPERKNYELRITNYGLEKKIKMLGWKSNLDEYYHQADVFILTSNYEGWSLSAIEAASFGLPIIMTDVGCAGEIIKNNESGIVIPVGGRETLQKAMVELTENKELRKKLGSNALAAVSGLPGQEQSWQLYKESLEKAFK